MSRRFLVTFATDDFAEPRATLVESAYRSGQFDEVFVWDENKLRTTSPLVARWLVEHKRGAGFWSWKPHIILDTLQRVAFGDIVVYSDVGRYRGGYTVERDISPLVDFCARNRGLLPGVLAPSFGANSRWTKRDCFVLMDCDSPYYWNHPQIQATFSVWAKTEFALSFVKDWSTYCSDMRIVGDAPNTLGLPNLPGFVDHRHDQSVLTNLALKHHVRPYSVESTIFNRLASARPKSLSASLVLKNIDNVTSIAAGTHPLRVLAREVVASAFVSRLRGGAC